jgi:hypothetical protein
MDGVVIAGDLLLDDRHFECRQVSEWAPRRSRRGVRRSSGAQPGALRTLTTQDVLDFGLNSFGAGFPYERQSGLRGGGLLPINFGGHCHHLDATTRLRIVTTDLALHLLCLFF